MHKVKIIFLLYIFNLTICVPDAVLGQSIIDTNKVHKNANEILYRKTAERFARAISNKNVRDAKALIATPLSFRNQEWDSAPSGFGFVLGRSHDEVFYDFPSASSFVGKLSMTTELESTRSINVEQSFKELENKELKGLGTYWSKLIVFSFLRGVGDLEHSMLIGVDPCLNKVKGIYIN